MIDFIPRFARCCTVIRGARNDGGKLKQFTQTLEAMTDTSKFWLQVALKSRLEDHEF